MSFACLSLFASVAVLLPNGQQPKPFVFRAGLAKNENIAIDSPDGITTAIIRPLAISSGGSIPKASSVDVLRYEGGTSFQRVWAGALVNQPKGAMLTNGPEPRLVTLDDKTQAGDKHAIVIYDWKGKLIADLALEQVLPDLALDKIPFVNGTRSWLTALPAPVLSQDQKSIFVPWDLYFTDGTTIDLQTGTIKTGSHIARYFVDPNRKPS